MSHPNSRVKCKVVQRKTRHRPKPQKKKQAAPAHRSIDPRVRSKVVTRRPRTRSFSKEAESQRALQTANERIYVLQKELGRAKRRIRLYKSILKRVHNAVREYTQATTDQ